MRLPALSIGANTSSFCPGPKKTPNPPRMTVLSLNRAGAHAKPTRGPKLLKSGSYHGVPGGQNPPHATRHTLSRPSFSLTTE